MAIIRWALLAFLLVFAAVSILWFFQVGPFAKLHQESDTYYRCPMHPQIVQDHPGSCPICGMTLVPFEANQESQAQPQSSGEPQGSQDSAGHEVTKPLAGQYTCPMHPEIVRDEPGNCPICGMALVQIAPPSPPPPSAPEAASAVPPPPALSAEHSEVHLDTRRLQMIGARTGHVERKILAGEILTVAIVTVDESRLSMIHTKVPGWIERLLVSRTGERVSRGQVVARLHSLELIAAQEDFLSAQRNVKTLSGLAGRDTETILEASRRRLRLLGMADPEIESLAQKGEVQHSIDILSPASGFVVSREVLEGHQVEPGTTLLTIGDLSKVWALLDLYEFDVGRVRAGQRVEIQFPALPGEVFRSKVDYVYPLMDQRTRTTKARVVLSNPDGRILPGMFGDARIEVEPRDTLVIPFDALLDNGTERYVFVVSGPGHFVPTSVRVGFTSPQEVEILAGLSEGQEVVTSANFLLDSESRMLGAAAREIGKGN